MFSAVKTQLCQLLFRQPRLSDYLEPLVQWWWPEYMADRYQARIVRLRSQAGCLRIRLKVGRRYPAFRPGQHLQLQLLLDGRQLERSFSICSALSDLQQHGELELAVRINPQGQFTGRLGALLRPGLTVHLSAPTGDFYFRATQPAVMVAAGSGITPLFAMLASASRLTQPVTLLYMFRGPQAPLFAAELAQLQQRFPLLQVHYFDSCQQRLQFSDWLAQQSVTADLAFYLCGPDGLMTQWQLALSACGVSPTAVHHENYHGLTSHRLTHDAAATGTLTVYQREQVLQLSGQGLLLQRLEQHGLHVQSGCRRGVCMQCLCHKRSGQVRNVLTGELSDHGSGYIQLCISEATSAVAVELPGAIPHD